MGTEFHATAAVDADKGFAGRIQVDGIDRASPGAGLATNAQLFPDHNAAPFSLRKSPRGARRNTRCRIAGQARLGLETGGKTACRLDPDSRLIPGKVLVHQTGAGQGTGVTTDTPLHAGSAQNFHADLLLTRHSRNQTALKSQYPNPKFQIMSNHQMTNFRNKSVLIIRN